MDSEYVNVTIRTRKDTKEKIDSLCEEFGITFNAAVNIFLTQMAREEKIPFEIRKNIPVTYLSDKKAGETAKKIMQDNDRVFEELAK